VKQREALAGLGLRTAKRGAYASPLKKLRWDPVEFRSRLTGKLKPPGREGIPAVFRDRWLAMLHVAVGRKDRPEIP
jgi:hypothetical protein